jgi:hypothetical protein
MTLSKSERIMAAVAATLGPTAGIGARVFRNRWEAVARNEMPCLVVEPQGEENQVICLPFLDWTLTLAVDTLISGAPLSTLADPIRVDAHSRLMADESLGGLAFSIEPGRVEWSAESGEIGILSMTYGIIYRTLATDLTQ